MIPITCNQYRARAWFKSRTPINLAIVFVGFLVLVLLLPNFIDPLIADVIALAIAYIVLVHILAKWTIAITCPHCNGHIETNTPWKCGNPNCGEENVHVDDFPFVYHCEHCRVEPKAFECPHPKCQKIIYLTSEQLDIFCARIVKPRQKSEPPPPRRDPDAEKRRKQHQEKSDLEHDVEIARLKAKLKEEQSKTAGPPPKKTAYEDLEDYFESMMANEKAEREWRAIIDEQFKNDPVGRAKAHKVVDQWMRNRPDM